MEAGKREWEITLRDGGVYHPQMIYESYQTGWKVTGYFWW